MNNEERVTKELERECAKLAAREGHDAQKLLDLTLAIVKVEHGHQEQRTNVNKAVATLIRNASSEG